MLTIKFPGANPQRILHKPPSTYAVNGLISSDSRFAYECFQPMTNSNRSYAKTNPEHFIPNLQSFGALRMFIFFLTHGCYISVPRTKFTYENFGKFEIFRRSELVRPPAISKGACHKIDKPMIKLFFEWFHSFPGKNIRERSFVTSTPSFELVSWCLAYAISALYHHKHIFFKELNPGSPLFKFLSKIMPVKQGVWGTYMF